MLFSITNSILIFRLKFFVQIKIIVKFYKNNLIVFILGDSNMRKT